MRSIRIGIDGRAFSSPAAGVRRYTSELTRALIALGEPLEVIALGGRDVAAIPSGVSHVAEPPHPPTNLGWTLVGLPRAAASASVDLIHAPAYTAPFWSRAPVVLTIHDVSYARRPEWYPYRRDWARRAFYRRSAHSAAQIITDSSFSADEIRAAYGVDRRRITVVPLGVDEGFVPLEQGLPTHLPARVVEPYLLHVGDLHERRNLPTVVDALIAARQQFGGSAALSLVLAGVDRGVGGALCEMAAAAGVPDAVVALGEVGEDRLRALYQHATALVYPSLYEGFGLPPLEAMACGVPVIASKAASMPEVVGDAGLLLEPLDVSAWTDAVVRVVNDEHLRRRLRSEGLHRAAQFTWARTARLTVEVYRRVARA